MNYRHRAVFLFAIMILTAVCLPASVGAQATPAERTFSGKVGNKYRVQMRLRRDGGKLSGSWR